jgi:hypothetical protein
MHISSGRIFCGEPVPTSPENALCCAPSLVPPKPTAADPKPSTLLMIRFVLRFLGLWILAAAFIFLVYDGTKSIAANAIHFTKAKDMWSSIHHGSREAFEAWVVQKAPAWVWDPVVRTLLEQPTWLILGVLGAILIVLGQKKKPLIGYARR